MSEQKTERPKGIAAKLAAASAKIGFVEFDATNARQGWGFASAGGVLSAVNRALSEVGVAVSSEVLRCDQRKAGTTANGAPITGCTVHLRLTLYDADDASQCITTDGVGSGSDSGDKAVMKASTAAYKYALAHCLVLGWGAVDPEGDEHGAPDDRPRDQQRAAQRQSAPSAQRAPQRSGGGGREVDVIPFGRDKGTRFGDAERSSLLWFKGCLENDLADASKERWHGRARAQLDALRAELARRDGGAAPSATSDGEPDPPEWGGDYTEDEIPF